MEASTIFGLLLIAALIAAVVIFVLPKFKKKNDGAAAPADGTIAHLVEALRSSVPGDVHTAAIDALKTSVPAVTRTPISPLPAPLTPSAAGAQNAPTSASSAAAATQNAPAGSTAYTGPYPATHNWGDWRDVREGESPDAYLARTGLGGYGKTTEQLLVEQQARVDATDWGKQAATAMATGLFDPLTLSDTDLRYIMGSAHEMNFDPRQLGQGLLYGPAVSRMGSQQYEQLIADFPAAEQATNPAVVNAIRQMAQGSVLPWMATAFPEFVSPRWRDEKLASWAAGWRRLHPGMEP